MLSEIAGYCEVCHKPMFWRSSDLGGSPSRSLVGVCVGVEIDEAGRTINPGVYMHYECRGGISDADRLATLESAILTIIKSMNEYLPPTGGDKDKFISEVIGAVDNAKVNKALEGKK